MSEQRPIKFRVWDGERMHCPSPDNFWFDSLRAHSLVEGPDIPTSLLLKASDIVVMQYTGLTDASGQEIYEGDVVEYEMFYANRPHLERKAVAFAFRCFAGDASQNVR